MIRDYLTETDHALARCWRCQHLTPDELDARRVDVYKDIIRTQTRQLEPLPSHVWPHGRALNP